MTSVTPQTVERKMSYPKGRIVVVRDSTVAISCNHNSGATLLSVLLFWYDHPQKYDTYNDDEHTFTVCRTQIEIEEAACHQIDAKTIHDSAVPLLHLFGYLTVTEKMNGNLYTLHMDHVFAAYTAYEQGAKALHDFLYTQLEISPIDIPSDQLEEVLIKKRKLSLQIEKTLIRLRENSHCKRGRKPKPQEAAEGISEKDRILENFRESNSIDSHVASAHTESDGAATFLSSLSQFEEPLKEVQQNGSATSDVAHLVYLTDDGLANRLNSGSTPQAQAAINGQAPLDVSSHKREGRSQEEPVVKPTETSLSSGSTRASHDNDITSQEEALREIPTQVALIPALPVTPTKTPPINKTDETGESKKRRTMKECPPEIQARRRTWQEYYNQRRGGELLRGKGERIAESNAIADLVNDFTDTQIQAIDRFVLAEIFPYKLAQNAHKVGARIDLNESQNAREVLKERRRWPSQDTKAGDTLSTDAGPPVDKYVAEIRRRAAETAARNALQEVAL